MTAPTVVDESPGILGDVDIFHESPDGDTATQAAAAGSKPTRILRRYEVVIAAVGAIVLIVRLAGGGFIHQLTKGSSDQAAPAVAPFTEDSGAPEAPAPGSEITDATLPPAVESALPSGATLPSSVRTALTPTTARALPKSAASAGTQASTGATSTAAAGSFDDSGALGQSFPLAKVPAPGAPAPVVVGSAGDFWIATDNTTGQGAAGPSQVLHYGADGAPVKAFPLDGIQGITALAPASEGSLYLTSRSPAAVYAFDMNAGTTRKLADIPDKTPCVPPLVTADCDASVGNATPLPTALAVDKSGAIFVADAAQGAIWKVPAAGGTQTQVTAQQSWTNPARPSGPSALAFDGGGNLVVAVRSLLTEDVGVIYVVPIGGDGKAGAPKELARTDQGSRPAGLALGVSGKVYITLSGLGRVLVLGPDGKEQARTPAAASPALDTPVGIAFRGHSLIVVAQAPSRADGGQVVRLPVGEAGAPRLAS